MTEMLMDCHERELMNLEPYDIGTLPHCTGLIQRGMLVPKPYITKKGKQIMAGIVTIAGRRYLQTI